jgi:hypothetical protein
MIRLVSFEDGSQTAPRQRQCYDRAMVHASASRKGCRVAGAARKHVKRIHIAGEWKMHQTGGQWQRFLWLIRLSMALWLVSGGAFGTLWLSEGATPAETPRRVATEWPDVMLEVTSVEPTPDNMLILRFQYVNSGSVSIEIAHSAYDILQKVYYIDKDNKRKYSAARSSTGLATILGTDRPGPVSVGPGQSVSLWVTFPAPPPGVNRIDLYFPHARPMENVLLP